MEGADLTSVKVLAAEVVALRADKNFLIGGREYLREELDRERAAREAAERAIERARDFCARAGICLPENTA